MPKNQHLRSKTVAYRPRTDRQAHTQHRQITEKVNTEDPFFVIRKIFSIFCQRSGPIAKSRKRTPPSPQTPAKYFLKIIIWKFFFLKDIVHSNWSIYKQFLDLSSLNTKKVRTSKIIHRPKLCYGAVLSPHVVGWPAVGLMLAVVILGWAAVRAMRCPPRVNVSGRHVLVTGCDSGFGLQVCSLIILCFENWWLKMFSCS